MTKPAPVGTVLSTGQMPPRSRLRSLGSIEDLGDRRKHFEVDVSLTGRTSRADPRRSMEAAMQQ